MQMVATAVGDRIKIKRLPPDIWLCCMSYAQCHTPNDVRWATVLVFSTLHRNAQRTDVQRTVVGHKRYAAWPYIVCERLIKITIYLNVLVMSQKKIGKTNKCKCLMCRISISHRIFFPSQKSPIGGNRMKISYSHLVDESICSFGSHHFYLLIQFFFLYAMHAMWNI